MAAVVAEEVAVAGARGDNHLYVQTVRGGGACAGGGGGGGGGGDDAGAVAGRLVPGLYSVLDLVLRSRCTRSTFVIW